MRRIRVGTRLLRTALMVPVAVMGMVLSLAPEVAAQSTTQAARTDPLPAEVAAQASFDTSYLLALYMTQLATAGSAPSQADIDEASRQYFTNGAAATGVPNSGPGAAYFQNGAAVTGVPTTGPGAAYFQNGAEVFAYYPAPGITPTPAAPVEGGAEPTASGSYAEGRSEQPTTETLPNPNLAPTIVGEPAAASEASRLVTTAASELTCSPRELEAAMAIAAQFAAPSAAPQAPVVCTPSIPPPSVCPQTSFVLPAEPAARCPPGRLLLSRTAPAVAGALFGALAMALLVRSRPPRAPQRRTPLRGRA